MKNKILIAFNKTECCGCGACVNICPKNAIKLHEDEYGFVFPKIDEDKCIGCKLCEKTCFYKNEIKLSSNIKCFAIASSNKEICKNSASGGMFYTIALKCMQNGFVCYGCDLQFIDSNPIIKHIRVDNVNDLKKLQGSKYVQSDISDIYLKVKNDLLSNKKVLFSGTPCQVSALKRYLDTLKINVVGKLYTIDLICHGVPSQKMFRDYLNSIYPKMEKINFKFRDKSEGWGLLGKLTLKNKNKIIIKKIYPKLSSYYTLFLNNEIFRESCYNCKFANKDRISDITIGDYWGIEKTHSNLLIENGGKLSTQDGISCLMINTDNGIEIFELIKKDVIFEETLYDEIIQYNHNLKYSSSKGKYREEFLKIYKDSKEFSGINKWYKRNLGFKYYIFKLWFLLPLKVRKKIKK